MATDISERRFAGATVEPIGDTEPKGALATTDAARAVAEVQAALLIARSNPRDEDAAIGRIVAACGRLKLAEDASYEYARGGTEITGPSIRLAEVMAQHWGNIQYGLRELEQRGAASVVQAYAWDVQSNTRREMTFTVRHVRSTKRGSYTLSDPRDVYELVANSGARRVRACILGVIPGYVAEEALEACDATLSKVEMTPDKLAKLLECFAEFGVQQWHIEKRIQRNFSEIKPTQFLKLRRVYASLRDGMSTPAEWFEVEAETADKAAAAAKKAKGDG